MTVSSWKFLDFHDDKGLVELENHPINAGFLIAGLFAEEELERSNQEKIHQKNMTNIGVLSDGTRPMLVSAEGVDLRCPFP